MKYFLVDVEDGTRFVVALSEGVACSEIDAIDAALGGKKVRWVYDTQRRTSRLHPSAKVYQVLEDHGEPEDEEPEDEECTV